MRGPFVKVEVDRLKEVKDWAKLLEKQLVMVGVPEDKSGRKSEEPITNAALAYIHNFGSPDNNIPSRPFMEIGLKAARDEIASEMSRAAASPDLNKMYQHLNRAGLKASQSIKNAINEQDGIEPLAGSTLRARERRGFKGTKALIETGQLRNSITWVVKR